MIRARAFARPLGSLPLALVVAVLIARSCAGQSPEGEVTSAATARVDGPPKTVFDWSSQACSPDELPDAPVRAFRNYRDRIQLVLPFFENWRLTGPNLNHVHVTCRPIMASSLDPDPADFNDREWIASPFTRDGRDVVALVHNEYHGTLPGTCVPNRAPSCWYNAITFARSSDGGRSFHQPAAPRQLVAASPYRYRPGRKPTGIFSASNIVQNDADGLYYAMVVSRTPNGDGRTCLMRTADPFKPRSWRAWDGSGFGLRFGDPYREPPAAKACTPVSRSEIGVMHESLTFNTYLDRFILVGMAEAAGSGRPVSGVYFSLSDDLVHWSARKVLMKATPVQRLRCGGPKPIAYPSLLDPESRSRTFSTTGRRPYLYFTVFNYAGCKLGLDRDLVRVPVELAR